MHYMRITDNDEDFSRLAERLVENGFSASSELGSGNYILCRFSGKNDASLLKIISDYIWDVKFLHYVIMRSKQREEQYLRALDIIIDTMNVANSFKDEDDVIIERLREYFREYKDINIDGFVNFRLKDFLADFDKLLDFYDSSYEVEAEYFDFIGMLKNYLEHQPEGAYELHVVCPGGVPYILDSEGNDITEESIALHTNPVADADVTRDDRIVSSLISMAPHILHLHTDSYNASPMLYETLKAIFACRVIVE